MDGALSHWGGLGLRLAIGGLFVAAGALKVLDPVAFTQSIEGYRILSGWPAALLALYLPWVEIFSGLGVILKRLYPGALLVLMGLTLVFLTALVSAWVRGLDIECGCFGSDGVRGQIGFALVRDLVLMAAIVCLWRWHIPGQQKARLD